MEGILERLRREVKQRRLLLYPYFRDYDRVSREDTLLIYHEVHVVHVLYMHLSYV